MAMSNLFYGPQDGLTRGASPTMLAVGDSWFWYPFNNLLGEIARRRPQQSIVVAGYNGAEAGEWNTKFAESIKVTFDFFARGPLVRVLLLSGGGNDIVGTQNFPKLLKANCSTCNQLADCYAAGQPDAALAEIEGHYRTLIARFRGYNPGAVVVLHNYDKAWPTGDGVFGPADWLKVPMDGCQVPQELRAELFADLVDRLGLLQERMAGDPALDRVLAVKTAGTLDGRGWANELHPTSKGFKRLVEQKFLPALDGIDLAPPP